MLLALRLGIRPLTESPGRSSAPCPDGPSCRGVELRADGATSERSALPCSGIGENGECKNWWSINELLCSLCIFWVCFAMLSPSVNTNKI